MRSACNLGADGPLFFSESALLGEATAGAYSNADLVSNFMGMMFYRNLTDEVSLKGRRIPPMLERDGEYWRISQRVRPDSDFFSLFCSDHLDEALNPSRYVDRLRSKIRKGITEHAGETIDRYADAHGNRRSPAYFNKRLEELSTYWGFDYGHKGDPAKDLLTIANTCYPEAPKDGKPDAMGMTTLHRAAQDGDVERVRQQLAAGKADVNVRVRSNERRSPEWGSTPLHYAVRDGHADVVKLLIDNGADVNAANDRGVTPLHRAIACDGAMAKLLIERGAKVEAADERGRTPLHWAAVDGTPEAMTALVDAGSPIALPEHEGRAPLHAAAVAGNESAVKALIARGASADVADRLGKTPLHLAARNGSDGVVAALLAGGAKADVQDTFGVTPLQDAARGNAPAVASRLLEAGANPMLADAYGSTPLHVAARYGRTPVARVLLAAGADAKANGGARGSPIDEARRANRPAMLALLRETEPAPAAQPAAAREPAN